MVLWLYRFIIGYLLVEFSGEHSEEILNLTAKSRIKLWGLKCNKGKITGYISIRNFFKLRSIVFSSHIKVKIIKKYGLPLISKRYNNRVGMYLGVVIFLSILKIMSGFIWTINIQSEDKIDNKKVLAYCKDLGIYEGVRTSKIDPKNDAVKLVMKNGDISWASLNIEGSILNVNLKMTKGNYVKKSPSNIKAKYDGIIKKIDATSGDVLVKTGDVVKSGDLLISGIIENGNNTVFTNSSGVITAETQHTFSSSGKKIQKVFLKTGKIKKHSVLNIFGLNLPLYIGETNSHAYENIHIKQLTLFRQRLPVSIITKICELKEYKTMEYSREKLISLLENDIQKQADKSNLKIISEYDSEISESESEIYIEKTYICEENIAMEEAIIVNTIN